MLFKMNLAVKLTAFLNRFMIMPRWLQQFYMEIHLNARTIAIQTNEDVLWSLATTYHRRKFKREKKTN